jgi:hypothetical protein
MTARPITTFFKSALQFFYINTAGLPFLKIGEMKDVDQDSGRIPCSKLKVKNSDKG